MTREDILACIKANELDLKPSQPRLSIPIIIRLCKKMKAGIIFPDIKVENGTICDGHHRYIASLVAKVGISRVPSILKSDIIDWKSVVFDDDDWDDKEKIERLNKIDAHYNNMTLEQLLEILK
jgi:hypothetical protein